MTALGGHVDVVQYLLEEQVVDVTTASDADHDGWSAMHYAALGGDLSTVKYLAEAYNVDLEATEEDGRTPLHIATNKGALEVVKYLLEEHKVNQYAVVQDVDQNALHLASSKGLLHIVKYLMEQHDFDILLRTSAYETPLHLASIYGRVDIVKYFLESQQGDKQLELMFARNSTNKTTYEAALNIYKKLKGNVTYEHQGDMMDNLHEVVKVLRSYVALAAVPLNANEPCVKLNGDLSEGQQGVAARTIQVIEATPANEVAYHVLGYLCMSDLMA
jgi:ankyrin repeat protein